MTNPKYAPFDWVKVRSSTRDPAQETLDMIGSVYRVRKVAEPKIVSVWNAGENDSWWFYDTDLEPSVPPDEIEQRGVAYVRKDRIKADKGQVNGKGWEAVPCRDQ